MTFLLLFYHKTINKLFFAPKKRQVAARTTCLLWSQDTFFYNEFTTRFASAMARTTREAPFAQSPTA